MASNNSSSNFWGIAFLILVGIYSYWTNCSGKKKDKEEPKVETTSENDIKKEKKKYTTLDDFKDFPGYKHYDFEDDATRKKILKNCGFDFEEAEYHVTTLVDREQFHIMSIKNLGIKPPYECSIIYTVTLSDKRTGEEALMNITIIKAHDRYVWEDFEF